MTGPNEFQTGEDEHGRADKIVAARFPGTSRRRLAELFARGAVRIEGKRAKKGTVVGPGQRVRIDGAPISDEALRPVPEAVELEILHEDAVLIAVAKPPGMPTQPLVAGERGTLAGALCGRFPELSSVGDDPREAGLAHRLDAGTSGVILACRDQPSWRALRDAFGAGRIDKDYLALVAGRAEAGGSEAPLLQRGPRSVVDATGLAAITHWTVVERFGDATLLSCRAETGRMHQVRAHLADVGHPIVGDEHYGGPAAPELTGHFLHAERIALLHPRTGERLEVRAPLPADRSRALQARR